MLVAMAECVVSWLRVAVALVTKVWCLLLGLARIIGRGAPTPSQVLVRHIRLPITQTSTVPNGW